HQITTGGGKLGAGPSASVAIVAGWNLQHCYTSVWFTPDNVNFYIYAFDREGTFWFYGINTPLHASAQEELVNVCRTGQLYGVFVTNAGTGAYDEIWDKW
ncbi:MAG: hypothetical protein ACREDM_16110, partial [Methylocella sp.]